MVVSGEKALNCCNFILSGCLLHSTLIEVVFWQMFYLQTWFLGQFYAVYMAVLLV